MSLATVSQIGSMPITSSFNFPQAVLADQKIRPLFFSVIKTIASLAYEETPRREFATYLQSVSSKWPNNPYTSRIFSLTQEFNQGLIEENLHIPGTQQNEFKSWVENITIAGHLFLDSQMIAEILRVEVPPSMESYVQGPPEMLSCFEYAFCQIEDARALCSEYGDIVSSLENWGYRQVAKPTQNDLVLYLKDGEPTHLGVYRGKALVQSKWGNKRPVAYLHRVNVVPESYGNEVMFFRPLEKKVDESRKAAN